MPIPTGYLTRILTPLLLLAACGSDHGLHRTANLLNDRLQTQLAPDTAAGAATLQPLPDGAQVILLGTSSFTNDINTRTDRYREVRASVIEGLLDPGLIHIAVADSSNLPDDQRAVRVRNVTAYFQDNGLGQSLLPDAPASASAQPGLTITIRLDCPAHRQPTNWNNDPPIPSCY